MAFGLVAWEPLADARGSEPAGNREYPAAGAALDFLQTRPAEGVN